MPSPHGIPSPIQQMYFNAGGMLKAAWERRGLRKKREGVSHCARGFGRAVLQLIPVTTGSTSSESTNSTNNSIGL